MGNDGRGKAEVRDISPQQGRLRLARCIIEQDWPIASAAQRFQVPRPTATRWARRYTESDIAGWATGLLGHIGAAPPVVRKVVHLPWKQRLDPVWW